MCKLKRFILRKTCKFLHEPMCIFMFFALLIVLICLFIEKNNEFLTTMIAAFFGSFSAFLLNTSQSKKREMLKNRASLEKAKYCIDIISKNSDVIQEWIDEKCKNASNFHFDWEKLFEYDSSFFLPTIDIESLMFLIDNTKDGKSTLNSILLVHAESKDIINVLNQRNGDYANYLNKTEGKYPTSKDELEQIIGPKNIKRLEQLTDRFIEINKNILVDCKKAEEKIKDFLKNYLM